MNQAAAIVSGTAQSRAFVKMHGLGNDFVIFDGRQDGFAPTAEDARRIADRHLGIGCDQVITMLPAANADVFMLIQNPDGSESSACGNATRCVADLVMEEAGLVMEETGRDAVTVETRRGVLACAREADGRISVDMGAPRLDWRDIPLAWSMDTLDIDYEIECPGGGMTLRAPVGVNMGNPHAVFFVADAAAVDLTGLGPEVEHAPLFPERVNVSIAEVRGRDRIRLRVWERGAGVTLACGSAACAAVVAATRRGLVDGQAAIEMDGGILDLRWREEDGHVLMTGPTSLSFRGVVDLGGEP